MNSKITKYSVNQLQSQELLSSKIDLMNTRFESIDAKLATITAALLTQAKPMVIAKKGEGSSRHEESKKATDDPGKKRTKPDSSRKDIGPVVSDPSINLLSHFHYFSCASAVNLFVNFHLLNENILSYVVIYIQLIYLLT